MGCVTKTLGRILFATILVSSAYLHLNKPETYVQDFNKNYSHLHEFVAKLAAGILPEASAINWLLWVKIFGLFEGLIALLIVFGDGLGGLLLFLTLVVSGVFDYCQICSFLQWESDKQVQFARYLFFAGASLTMICCGSCQKSSSCGSKQQCNSKQACKKACC